MLCTPCDDDDAVMRDQGKRCCPADADGGSGHTRAVKVLQNLLPLLRPKTKGSPSTESRLHVLLEHWTTSAGVKVELQAPSPGDSSAPDGTDCAAGLNRTRSFSRDATVLVAVEL